MSLYLVTHAVMQTIAESMFGLRGFDCTKYFLSHYVDGSDTDKRFSLVSDEIHAARNVLAHQGYSTLQHRVEYFNNEIPEGWKRDSAGTVHINPNVYAQFFSVALTKHSFVADYK